MVILRRRLKKENKKDTSFIGASIPKDMVSFLSLFCLAKEVTKTSIVKDTMFAKLAMVDPIIVALPSSIIATLIGSFSTKNDIPKEHVDRCFNGI